MNVRTLATRFFTHYDRLQLRWALPAAFGAGALVGLVPSVGWPALLPALAIKVYLLGGVLHYLFRRLDSR